MTPRRYVICDIEATGLDADCEMIELAIITYEEDKILEVYETLINPLRSVPNAISDLTGITNRELTEAPKFYELADAIRMRLEGAVFVSHNTEFDLGLLKKKFKEMGQDLKVKNFCTLKVSQHEIPGLLSYSLDALCSFFHIKIRDRHRAVGDARATLELFKELLQLRLKVYPKILHLPHHEKDFKDLPARPGLIYFKNSRGKVIRFEASFNMEKTARELLVVKAESRDLLIKTQKVEGEATGLTLIAEFKKLLFEPYRAHSVISTEEGPLGEMSFKLAPYKKGMSGLWFFKDPLMARKKLKTLEGELLSERYLYREGEKSKEEILKHNQKVHKLSKEARFPADNLVIVGEGRVAGERALVLVRNNHVLGYGYTEATPEDIFQNPDAFLTRRFFQHLGVDLAARKYIRILKNVKHKTESWRALAES